MKNKNLLLMFLALSLFGLKANAQKVDSNSGLVVWTGMTLADAVAASASEDGFVYLLQFKPTLSETDKEKYISPRWNVWSAGRAFFNRYAYADKT